MAQELKHLDDNNFQTEVGEGLALVDFFADWCGPCKTIAPIVEQLAVENVDKVKVVKVNVDESQATTASFGVTSIPTLILLKDGKEVKRFVGVTMKAQLQEALNKHL